MSRRTCHIALRNQQHWADGSHQTESEQAGPSERTSFVSPTLVRQSPLTDNDAKGQWRTTGQSAYNNKPSDSRRKPTGTPIGVTSRPTSGLAGHDGKPPGVAISDRPASDQGPGRQPEQSGRHRATARLTRDQGDSPILPHIPRTTRQHRHTTRPTTTSTNTPQTPRRNLLRTGGSWVPGAPRTVCAWWGRGWGVDLPGGTQTTKGLVCGTVFGGLCL